MNTDGDKMFTCHSGDGIADEFEVADDDSDDSDELYTDVAGEKVADGLYGSHECVFEKAPTGVEDSNVKLVVTQEANANYQNSITGEFNAELLGYGRRDGILDGDVHINCFKSGNGYDHFYVQRRECQCCVDFQANFSANRRKWPGSQFC